MFNIRNLVSRISQAKDGEVASDTSSTKSRSTSQTSNVYVEEPLEAEGFICPTCMASFPSQDDLQTHYQQDHLEPGANYLCPVCKARLNTASDLELHYATVHSSSAARSNVNVDSLVQELSELNSSLNEEKWASEELRKEIAELNNLVKAQGTSEEHQMYQQQLSGLQETKSLLTSEVVLLRKQLSGALESTLQLKQEREKLEDKAARHSQRVAELQAALDENSGLTAALQEKIQHLESQLELKANVDDAEVLRKELASVQRLMDELASAKEMERDVLQSRLDELQMEHEALKNKDYSVSGADEDLIKSLEESKMELKRVTDELKELKNSFTDKNDQLTVMQRGREETDFCVGQLREEVTSLQEMLDVARNQAEGQVSAKEDELLQVKMQLIQHQQKVNQLEESCQSLQHTNQQLTSSLSQKERQASETSDSLKQMENKSAQMEEKLNRLEQERAELMVTIQKGEGFDTAIQQLQQDNSRLQEDLSKANEILSTTESQLKSKAADWIDLERGMNEEKVKLQTQLAAVSKQLEKANHTSDELRSSGERSTKETLEWKEKTEVLDSNIKELSANFDKQTKELQENVSALEKLQIDLKSSQEATIKTAREKEEIEAQLTQLQVEKEALNKMAQELQKQHSQLKTSHQVELDRLNEQLSQLRCDLSNKEQSVEHLKERVAELEPLTEAIEQEKMRRIKEKAEWGEHEQLLRGEKESLSTLSKHLQEQLDEQQAEHRIQLQRLKSETDGLVRDKTQLTQQLSSEKDERDRESVTAGEKVKSLEQEIKTLTDKLTATLDQSASHFQRCQELQTAADRYCQLKIELETRLALLQEDKSAMENNCSQWESEVERLKLNGSELRRRLEDSQAALHELGRENQSLQMENAKLQGRKWADDSEVDDCNSCQKGFNLTVRKHHCRNCGQIFCNECSARTTAVGNSRKPVRVCESCYKELNNTSPR